jgi:hypothetical protein
MKLGSLLLLSFSAVTISSAHAAPEAVARGERSPLAPASEIAFELESNQSARQAIRAMPPEQGGLDADTIDGSIGGTIRILADRAPEPDFLPLVP